jgi:hypothetical protein
MNPVSKELAPSQCCFYGLEKLAVSEVDNECDGNLGNLPLALADVGYFGKVFHPVNLQSRPNVA